MDNKVRDIFSYIHAEVALKEKTANFLRAEIQIRSRTRKVYSAKLIAVSASFIILLFVCGFSYNMYFTASDYIDIYVNPSIELTLNRFSRVIEAIPYNDDGANILKEVNVRHASYNQAVETLLEVMAQNGYLNQNVLLSVTIQASNGDRESDLLIGVKSTVTASMQAHHNDTQADIFSVTKEVKKHAYENHISPAKYIAISEFQEVDPTANFEECKEHTISELKQLREQHSGGHHDGGENASIITPNNDVSDGGHGRLGGHH